jgi:thioredoxin reductase (NADPH)
MTIENVVIIGSGPAGSTAALYASRANLCPVVLQGSQPGGQLTTTTDVENFPGYKNGVNGFELVMDLQQQAERFGARYVNHTVQSLKQNEDKTFTLTLDGDNVMEAKTVIVATGASARYLGLPNEDRLKNKGVSACATCDGAFFRDVPIVVVGGGDTAVEEALFLTRFASKVYLVHRRDQLRASKVMADRVLSNDKVEMVWNATVNDVIGENSVTAVELKDTQTGELKQIECGAMFLAIGHVPNTGFLKGIADMDDAGFLILPDKGTSHTTVEGIFAAGDCADHVYRQAIVASGMGCRAAMDAERWLAEQE